LDFTNNNNYYKALKEKVVACSINRLS